MLQREANAGEEFEPRGHGQLCSRRIGDGHAFDDSITKNGRPASVAPASKTRAMSGWHHRGPGVALEARDDGARVHAELDDLERDAAAHGLLLLGEIDGAKPPSPIF